jgi:membrane protein DedA with SNARE-associated domain
MLEQLIQFTQSIVSAGGAFGVFLAAVLEEVVFFIPSPIVPMTAGFFLLPVNANLGLVAIQAVLKIAIPVSLGLSLGSLFPYYICYFGGQPVIERWGRYFGLSWSGIKKTEEKFTRGYNDEIILLGLRILPIVPSAAISSFCGFIRYPVYHFLVVTFFGAATRGFLLGIFGWYVGTAYLKYAQAITHMEEYLLIGVSIVVLAILARIVIKKRRKRSSR